MIDQKLLAESLEQYGLTFSSELGEKLDLYAKLLVEWNEKINLTAITNPQSIVIKHFVDSSIPVGWSSTMALQLVLGGIILLVLGLTGEYIGRIYMCINASPQFVVRSVVKCEKEAGVGNGENR